TLISVLGSYSRGGLVALSAMSAFYWLRSRAKISIAFSAILVIGLVLGFMPQKYFDRINSISDAKRDGSVQGRFDAWEVAWEVALHRPFGAGFDGPRQPEIWDKYLPAAQNRASHSIYFMVLGEHGFIGLSIYLWIIIGGWANFSRIRKLSFRNPDLLWAQDLNVALQASTVGFLVGGAALPIAYYDGFFLILTIGVVTRHLLEAGLNPKTAGGRPIVDEFRTQPVGSADNTDAGLLPAPS
ncbi:MAG: putative O-glycosylation ligase, exosortase A system-associated, partial [Rhodospirillaceae bacterium]